MQVINLTNKKLISSCSSAVNGGNGNTNSVEGKGAVWGIQNISIMSRTLLQGMMNNVQRLGLRHFDWRLSSSKSGEHRYWWVEISQWKSFNTCNSLYDIYLRNLWHHHHFIINIWLLFCENILSTYSFLCCTKGQNYTTGTSCHDIRQRNRQVK